MPRQWRQPGGDHPFTLLPTCRIVYEHLAHLACWKDGSSLLKKQLIPLKRGQVATSLREIQSDLSCFSLKVIRLTLAKLEQLGEMGTLKSPQGTVITLLKYDEYFDDKEEEGTQTGTQRASKGHYTKKDKKLEEVKEELSIPPRKASGGPSDPLDLALAEDWAAWAKGKMPSMTVDLAKWADSFRKARTIDGWSIEELRSLFEFVKKDDFWSRQAYSPLGLRQRGRNDLLKLENIKTSMAKKKPRSSGGAHLTYINVQSLAEERANDRRSS